MAIPATGVLIGTPASIKDNEEPQTVAIDEEPLDSKISETILIVYGNSSLEGSTLDIDLSARAPWPISLLPGLPMNLVSPTENGGKL